MAGRLNVVGIGKLKTPGKYYDLTHGLFLQVYPSGAKCWQQRLTDAPGHRCTVGLGGYGARALLWGQCGDPRGPYTGAKIAYQSFPDMARLRWLGLVDAPAHASVRR